MLLQVDFVGRDDHASACHFGADKFGIEIFALGDEVHFLGDNALAGGFNLSHAE